MGGDDKARVTHVFLAAWSLALKFTSDSSLNPETVSTELSFAFPGEISELAVCQKAKITHCSIHTFSTAVFLHTVSNPGLLRHRQHRS